MLGLAISLAGMAENGYLTAIAVSMWPFQVGLNEEDPCACC